MFRQPGKNAKKKDKTALWEYALRVLSGRAYSTDELREKLRQRAENRSDVAGVIAKLQEYGYLDDVRFAENFAASRLGNQGFGRARVLRDLKSRRVPAGVAARAVEKVFEDTDETELIEHFLQRKYRSVSLPEYLADRNHLASAYRRLRYAGFSAAASIRVLKRYSGQAERLETLEEGTE